MAEPEVRRQSTDHHIIESPFRDRAVADKISNICPEVTSPVGKRKAKARHGLHSVRSEGNQQEDTLRWLTMSSPANAGCMALYCAVQSL